VFLHVVLHASDPYSSTDLTFEVRRHLLTKDGWLVISIVTVFAAMIFVYWKGLLTPSPTYFLACYDMP
jgi:hypothetical protein